MKRRRKNANQRIFNIVALIVVVSMVLGGLLVTIIPPSVPKPPSPTPLPATATLTATATATATNTLVPAATPGAGLITTPIPHGNMAINANQIAWEKP